MGFNIQNSSWKIVLASLDSRTPVILEDEAGNLVGSFWGEEKDSDIEFLESKVAEFLAKGKVPMRGEAYADKIYYFNTPSSARTSEQNRVWAGMAKETAHQLGTPISAIIGWIENLKLISEDDPGVKII